MHCPRNNLIYEWYKEQHVTFLLATRVLFFGNILKSISSSILFGNLGDFLCYREEVYLDPPVRSMIKVVILSMGNNNRAYFSSVRVDISSYRSSALIALFHYTELWCYHITGKWLPVHQGKNRLLTMITRHLYSFVCLL